MSLAIKHWLLKKLQDPKTTPLPSVLRGLTARVTAGLAAAGMNYAIYDKVLPNPPRAQVVEGYEVYMAQQCDGLIAVGGGSPMDCAKIIGALVCDGGKKPIESYVGSLKIAGRPGTKVNKIKALRYPPLVAIPTTAGTGSEATLAAVISFPEQQKKLGIGDPIIIPKAILDPEVIKTLPPHVTAATGMDALTHAVESYLSYWQSNYTAAYSISAVNRIGKWLVTSYEQPGNLEAREEMLVASYEAGVAFTRASVGYVHAVAHQLGALFGVPHGVANAMVMPYVLDYYAEDDTCTDRFCELAIAIGVKTGGDAATHATQSEKRALMFKFIARVRKMNADMNIPASVAAMTATDIDTVAQRALKEAHGEGEMFNLFDFGYPTPKYMTYTDMVKVVGRVVPAASKEEVAAGTTTMQQSKL